MFCKEESFSNIISTSFIVECDLGNLVILRKIIFIEMLRQKTKVETFDRRQLF